MVISSWRVDFDKLPIVKKLIEGWMEETRMTVKPLNQGVDSVTRSSSSVMEKDCRIHEGV